MKNFPLYILLIIFALTFALDVRAQTDAPDAAAQEFQTPPKPRANLLQELGLTEQQLQTIRRINQEKREQMAAAQNRLRDARNRLDEAIYADSADESEVRLRQKEFQAAQTEVGEIRTDTEFEIRRTLTPEQVARFRDLRRRFAEFQNLRRMRRQNRQDMNRSPESGAPNRLLRRQNLRQRKNKALN